MRMIMVRKAILLLVAWLLIVPAFGGCAQSAGSAPAATSAPAAAAAAATRPDWQREWDSLVSAARKEGKVVISASIGPGPRDVLAKAFYEKYGITLDFVVGRSTELLPKFTAERNAGLYLMDAHLDGISSQLDMQNAGFIEPLAIEPALLLPEVRDLKSWMGGKLNFVGQDRYALSFFARPTITLVTNTEEVKPGEIRSYRDLLDPKWKGKLTIQDPTVGGAGSVVMSVIAYNIMGIDYLKELAKQEPLITRDARQQIEWTARGKYPIMMAPDSSVLADFMKAKAPLQVVWPAEGTSLMAGHGVLSFYKNAPHPAARKLFLNWLLTREGQTLFARAAGSISSRVDVSADEWMDADSRIQPGYNYVIVDTEEGAVQMIKTRTLAKDIFAEVMK